MPASPSAARAINNRETLLLLRDGPLTAGQVARLTGLSRQTVADLLKGLGEAGLIEVVGQDDVRRRGPNAQLYGIVRTRAHVAALDVRTHSVAVVVADLLGDVLAEASTPIAPGIPTTRAVARTLDLLTDATSEAGAQTLHSIGIGVPGLVQPGTGELRGTPGPQWHGRVLTELRTRLHGRLVVENETNTAAVAEHRLGTARDREAFALLWLGHGTGAALVLGGALHRGASGGAGELGYLPVPDQGLADRVRAAAPDRAAPDPEQPKGFHALAGSPAVVELGAAHGIVVEPVDHEPPAAAVVRAAVANGQHAFLDDLADRVVVAAASVVAVLDPGCLVLGGEIGHAGGDALAGRVADRLAARSPAPTAVRYSALGGSAVLRGALLAACDAAQEELFEEG